MNVAFYNIYELKHRSIDFSPDLSPEVQLRIYSVVHQFRYLHHQPEIF